MADETDTATDLSPAVSTDGAPGVPGADGSVAVPDPPAPDQVGISAVPQEGEGEETETSPASPSVSSGVIPIKRPRGRPRKDGLPPGSPEAKAADRGEGIAAGTVTPADDGSVKPVAAPVSPRDPADVPGPAAISPPRVREQERTHRAKHPRARPLSEQPKQEPPKNVCTNQNCRASHPSQGGKSGVRCVETGDLVVAPMGREEGRQLMKQILSWIGKIVSFAFGGEVSDPTDMELGLITPPAIRLAHRFGIGEGNLTLDILMLLAGLSMYTMRVIQEARSGGQRVALPNAA